MARKGIALVCLFLLASCTVFGLDLRLKLSGGLGYFNLKDINRALKGWEEVWKTRVQISPSWSLQGGGVKRFQIGAEFEGEVILFLNRRLAFSLGSGYLYGEVSEKSAQLTIQRGVSTYVYAHPAKVSAIPLIVSGYFFFPLGKKMSLFLKAGGGALWAKYIDRDGERLLPAVIFAYGSSPQFATARGSLFEFGLGAKYNVEKNVSFFFEATGRASRPKHFQGELPDGTTGTLYFYEEYLPTVKLWQARLRLLTAAPEGEIFRSVREAVVDLNGFSLKIGIMIQF